MKLQIMPAGSHFLRRARRFQSGLRRRQRRRHRLSVHAQFLEHNRRWQFVPWHFAGLNGNDAFERGEPKSSVVATPCRWLISARTLQRRQTVIESVRDTSHGRLFAARESIQRLLSHLEDAVMRSEPQVPRLIVENLANYIAGQPALDGVTREVFVLES